MVDHVTVHYGRSKSRRYVKAVPVDANTQLHGKWEITIKIDGVRILWNKETDEVTTRNGTPVRREIADAVRARAKGDDFELYAGTWNRTMSVLAGTDTFTDNMLFMLYPTIDNRLYLHSDVDFQLPYTLNVMEYMEIAVASGHEGIVIRQQDKWGKAVPELTADVLVTGYREGAGRNKGRLGSLETARGCISGMSDELREMFWDKRDKLKGLLIEVKYRELTANGKFRFGSFVRIRTDKTEESI